MWTDVEEATFAEIMRVGNLARIKAIHLWARSKRNGAKALRLAAKYGADARALASAIEARTVNLKGVKEGHFLGQNRAEANATAGGYG